jgi:dTDP-4-amino-4,6-dideoxygalactose transaminase
MGSAVTMEIKPGTNPIFDGPLHVGRPNLPNRERLMEKICNVYDNQWLTNQGPMVRELEKKLTEYLGVRHCICMCNGTIALEIAIRALGLTGEVIVPSFTFVATAHALQWQEITPIFADIGVDTHTLDVEAVRRMITPRTSGIVGVHCWGRPCEIDSLAAIAEENGLALMFDAAHAFGCSYKGKMIGGFGRAEVFSFHATKFFNTLEGGAVTTDDDDLAEKMRLMRNFGFAGKDNVIYIGTNGKMNEISGAMGLASLEEVGRFIGINKTNYEAYEEGLNKLPGVSLLQYNSAEQNNYQYIVIEVDERKSGVSRDRLVEVLEQNNVLARRYFHPGAHRMEPYRSHFPHSGLLLPETEKVCEKVLLLPTGTTVDPKVIEIICDIIATEINGANEA